MKPAVAVAPTAQTRVLELPKITAVCRTIRAGSVEPEFVASEIARQGYPLQIVDSKSPNLADSDIVLFLGNVGWMPEVVDQLQALPRERRPFVAVWHWEPLPPSDKSGLPKPSLGAREIGKILLRDSRATDPYSNLTYLRRKLDSGLINFLAVSTLGRQEVLAERGYSSEMIPLGAGPEHGRDMKSVRDIDVLFLGDARVPRRQRILKELEKQGLRTAVAGSWEDPRYWGEQRTTLLNRVKILLNFPRTIGDYSGLRLLLGAVNGALVLSEPLYRPYPFVPGRHYVESELADIPRLARHFIDDPERRTAVTAAARSLAERATRKQAVQTLLESISKSLQRGPQS